MRLNKGDRVWLLLRDGRSAERRFDGVVIAVDDVSTSMRLIPGVRIALDEFCNGVRECYATHEETHKVTP